MSKMELEKARKAGAALRGAAPGSLPEEAVSDPVSACPFEAGDPQRVAWLEGYQAEHERLSAPQPVDMGAAIKEAAQAVKS